MTVNSEIKSIYCHKNSVYGGAKNGSVFIFKNFNQNSQQFLAHEGIINSIYVNNKMIITCGDDCYIRIWEIEKNKLLKSLGHHSSVLSFHYDENKRLLAACCGQIYFIFLLFFIIFYFLFFYFSFIFYFYFFKKIDLIENGTIRIWEQDKDWNLLSNIHAFECPIISVQLISKNKIKKNKKN